MDSKTKAMIEAAAWAVLAAFLISFGEGLKDGFQASDLGTALGAAGYSLVAFLRGVKVSDPFRQQSGRAGDAADAPR